MNPGKLLTSQIECVVQMTSDFTVNIPTSAEYHITKQDMKQVWIGTGKFYAEREKVPACITSREDNYGLIVGKTKQPG